ncbi:UTRA domain-containing protein, partial [Paracidovorax cattleyae]|uniref:UTRA domain-containing protein n=1 Tax=Paracidovorax cattleyae TaxID=80868 RepID=UPI001E2C0D7F
MFLEVNQLDVRYPGRAQAAVRGATLGLAAGEIGVLIGRLRLVDGEPCLLERIWLPLDLFAALEEGDPQDWGDLLYPFLCI